MLESNFYNILHLASRIHGLLAARLPFLSNELIEMITGAASRFKKPKQTQLETITNEIPVFLLIQILQETERREPDMKLKEADYLKSCLVHFFSIHFIAYYLERLDPIKEILTRVDWYLDGDEGTPDELFNGFVFNNFPELKESLNEPLARFTSETVPAEISRAMDLAPLYKI